MTNMLLFNYIENSIELQDIEVKKY